MVVTPSLMLAGLRFYAGRLPGAAVCRPASHSAAPAAAGLWPDHKFRSVRLSVLRYRPGYAGRAGLPCAAGARLFTAIILGAFVFGERLQVKQLAGIALAIFGVLVLVEGSLGGEHVPLVGFMLTLAAALSWACSNT